MVIGLPGCYLELKLGVDIFFRAALNGYFITNHLASVLVLNTLFLLYLNVRPLIYFF